MVINKHKESAAKYHIILDSCIILLILFIYRIPRFISNVFLIDVPVEEIFWILPCLVLCANSVLKKKFKLPFFWIFLILEIGSLVSESEYFRPGVEHNLVYAYYMLQFYSIYIAFIAYGFTRIKIEKILRYSILILIPYILVFYLNFFGIIYLNTFEYSLSQELDITSSRLTVGNLISVNGISFSSSYGILAATLLFSINNKYQKKYLVLLLLFLLGIIVLHASRGAFAVSLIIIVLFIKMIWRSISNFKKVMIVSCLFLLVISQFVVESSLKNLYIFERFTDEFQNVGRRGQIYVTWVNFKKNFLFGTGYSNAATGVLPGYSRSNFHYTQILASNGIFYFIIYLYFLIKMFGKNFKKETSLMFMIFGFSALMVYDWTLILSLSIVSYFVYWGNRINYNFLNIYNTKR
jgi:hypothetical protein